MSETNAFARNTYRAEALRGLPTIEGAGLSASISRERRHMCEEALYSCALAITELSHALDSPLVGTSARLSMHAARHEALRCARALEAVCAHTGAVPLSDAWHDRLVDQLEGGWDKRAGTDASPERPTVVERLRLWWEQRSSERAARRAHETDEAADDFRDPWDFDWGGDR